MINPWASPKFIEHKENNGKEEPKQYHHKGEFFLTMPDENFQDIDVMDWDMIREFVYLEEEDFEVQRGILKLHVNHIVEKFHEKGILKAEDNLAILVRKWSENKSSVPENVFYEFSGDEIIVVDNTMNNCTTRAFPLHDWRMVCQLSSHQNEFKNQTKLEEQIDVSLATEVQKTVATFDGFSSAFADREPFDNHDIPDFDDSYSN